MQAAQVKDIRVGQQPGSTRLVFELDSSVDHRMFPLSNPDRVVLDINDTDISQDVVASLSALSSDALLRVRYAKRDSGMRFVLDLNKKVKAKTTKLAASGGYGPRILVELDYGVQSSSAPTVVKSLASISDEKRDIVVVIDPGHGGKDPGALGQYKVREKDIVLSIGRELAKRLNAKPGIKAVMTRSTDVYLQLRDRSRVDRKSVV